MGYIENNLTSNEQIVYKGHLHWFSFVGGIVIIVAIWIAAAIATFYYLDALWLIFFESAIALLAIWLYAWLVSKNTEYYITNKRLIVKKGIIQRSSSELRLAKCEGVMVEQSMMGRIFNYGTVTISTGEVKNIYRFIANPLKFRTMLNENLDNIDDQNDA